MKQFLMTSMIVLAGVVAVGSPASADMIFDFSFVDSPNDFGNGHDTAKGAFTVNMVGPGEYQVTAIKGSIDGEAITGLSTYASADENLFVPGTACSNVICYSDLGGISFVASGIDYNIANDYGTYVLLSSLTDPIGNGIDVSPFTSFTVSAPEPLTLSIFGVALAGAAAMRRRRKASKAA